MRIKNHDFWIFRLGQALSEMGDICGTVALSWWLLDKTNSGSTLAAVIAPLTFLRMFLTVLFGPIADRFSRKKIALAGDLVRGILWLILALLSLLPEFHLPLVVLVYALTSVGSALFSAVITPMIFELGGSEQRSEAMRVAQTITASSTLFGAIFGGALVALVGYKWVIFLNAGTFFVGFFATCFIKMASPQVDAPLENTALSALRMWMRDTADGARYILGHPTLRTIGLIFMGVEFLLAPAAVVLPVLIKLEHQAPAWFLGGTYAVRSLGALVCLTLFKHLQKCVSRDARILQGLLVSMGLGYLLLALTTTPLTALAGALILGGSLSGVQVILIPRIGRMIDPAYQSRAFTALGFLAETGTPLGVAATGLLLESEKVSIFCLGIAIAFILYSSAIKLIPNSQVFWQRDH